MLIDSCAALYALTLHPFKQPVHRKLTKVPELRPEHKPHSLRAPLYSLFHTHLLVHVRLHPIVAAFSYTFAHPRPSAPQCTRFFIHICSPTSVCAPLYSLFHTHLLTHVRLRPIVLAFSYTFARPRPSAPRCTRLFIHICSSTSLCASLYSLFHTHLLVHVRLHPFVLIFSYTIATRLLSTRRKNGLPEYAPTNRFPFRCLNYACCKASISMEIFTSSPIKTPPVSRAAL